MAWLDVFFYSATIAEPPSLWDGVLSCRVAFDDDSGLLRRVDARCVLPSGVGEDGSGGGDDRDDEGSDGDDGDGEGAHGDDDGDDGGGGST